MKAARTHVKEPWIVFYIERWLKAPFEDAEHNVTERLAGTLQGGVIHPLLVNFFVHYTFDKWMRISYPYCPFERYADDAVIQCKSESQGKFILDKVRSRMEACNLELYPLKTKIVDC